MIDLYVFIYILTAHWVADFVLQTRQMAENKSKDNIALATHGTAYTLGMMVLTLNPMYALVNGIAHVVVDYYTSRLSSRMWKKGDVHSFFVVIGFDQLLHVATLAITYGLLWH